MQESLKMFDFPGGLLPSTYNLTFGRGNIFYTNTENSWNSANIVARQKFVFAIFQKLADFENIVEFHTNF